LHSTAQWWAGSWFRRLKVGLAHVHSLVVAAWSRSDFV
jgi:hypothetical protein